LDADMVRPGARAEVRPNELSLRAGVVLPGGGARRRRARMHGATGPTDDGAAGAGPTPGRPASARPVAQVHDPATEPPLVDERQVRPNPVGEPPPAATHHHR